MIPLAAASVLAIAFPTSARWPTHARMPAHHPGRAPSQHRAFPGLTKLHRLAAGPSVGIGVAPQFPIRRSLPQFVALIGRRPAVVGLYQQWSEPFLYPSQLRAISRLGALPMIAWDSSQHGVPIPLSRITGGGEDAYLRRAARSAAIWNRVILVRLDPEMNLASSPGHDGTPAAFVAAWRHVVQVFDRAGADNVRWVWTPNVDCSGLCPFSSYFPGARWVDWVGLDGYNYGTDPGHTWLSFQQVFARSYRTLTALSAKPMMIAETASSTSGGDKATWIQGMGAALQTDFRRVRLLVWFERRKEEDWLIESSLTSLLAFRTLLLSSLFAR